MELGREVRDRHRREHALRLRDRVLHAFVEVLLGQRRRVEELEAEDLPHALARDAVRAEEDLHHRPDALHLRVRLAHLEPAGRHEHEPLDERGVVERELDGHRPAVGVADDGAALHAERREELRDRAREQIQRVVGVLRLARVAEAERVGHHGAEAVLREVGVVAAEVRVPARAGAAPVQEDDHGALALFLVVHAEAAADVEPALGDHGAAHRSLLRGVSIPGG